MIANCSETAYSAIVRYMESQPRGLKNLSRPLHTLKRALQTATHSEIQPCHCQSRTWVNHVMLEQLKYECIMIRKLKEGKPGGKTGFQASFKPKLFRQWAVKTGVFVSTEREIVQPHKVQRARQHRTLRRAYNNTDRRIPSHCPVVSLTVNRIQNQLIINT